MELIRYFSFPYCFLDIAVRRVRHGILLYTSAVGFPSADDVKIDIGAHLTSAGIDADEISITGWQEFQNENDYRNFSN